MKKDNNNFKGFTMMETVVCLAVFAVTLAAAVPAFEEFNEKTDEHRFKSECKSILATAEVYAGESYKLGTDEAKLMADLQDQFPDCKIGNVVFEKGKVLSLEINRKENPRTMYYTDAGDFSTEKPADFERIKERSLARLVEFTPYEAPADPKIIPERTKPAVTTAPETVAATEPTTTTVTTPKPVTTETTITTPKPAATVTTTTTPEPTTTVTSTEPPKSETTVTTVQTSEAVIEELKKDDELIAKFRSTYSYKADEDLHAVQVSDMFKYDQWYSLGDLGYNWGDLAGVGITFSSLGEYGNGGMISLGKQDTISMANFGDDYCYVNIDQYSLNAAPSTIKFNAWGPGEMENLVFYFKEPVEAVIPAGAVKLTETDGCYYWDKTKNNNIQSVTIVYKDNAYGNDNNPGRHGTVVLNNDKNDSRRAINYSMTRKNERVVTVNVNSANATHFSIEQYSLYDADETIEAVYVNYK